MMAINQFRLFALESGTPLLKPWCAGAIIGSALLLGVAQWFLIGTLIGRFVEQRRTRETVKMQ